MCTEKKPVKYTVMYVFVIDSRPSKGKFMKHLDCLGKHKDLSPQDALALGVDPKNTYAIYGILRGCGDVLAECMRIKAPYVFIDNAFLGRYRTQMFSVTRNHMQVSSAVSTSPDRVSTILTKQERKYKFNPGDKHILVIPASNVSEEFNNCQDWLPETIKMIRGLSPSVEIVVSLKPPSTVSLARDPHASVSHEPVADLLGGAICVCAYNSRVAVDAALMGKPVFTSDKSIASFVSQTPQDIIAPKPVQKGIWERWCARVCNSMFTVSEIKRGVFKKYLMLG